MLIVSSKSILILLHSRGKRNCGNDRSVQQDAVIYLILFFLMGALRFVSSSVVHTASTFRVDINISTIHI